MSMKSKVKKVLPLLILGMFLVGCQEKKHYLPGDDEDISPGELVEDNKNDES